MLSNKQRAFTLIITTHFETRGGIKVKNNFYNFFKKFEVPLSLSINQSITLYKEPNLSFGGTYASNISNSKTVLVPLLQDRASPKGERYRVFLTHVLVALWSQLLWTDSTKLSILNVERYNKDLVLTVIFSRVMVPPHGFEPRTYWLQISCSTNWAIGAWWLFSTKHK